MGRTACDGGAEGSGDGVTGRYDRCVRCGQVVSYGQGACRACNPAGLPTPSPTQYHATVFLSVLAVMAILAVFLLLRA